MTRMNIQFSHWHFKKRVYGDWLVSGTSLKCSGCCVNRRMAWILTRSSRLQCCARWCGWAGWPTGCSSRASYMDRRIHQRTDCPVGWPSIGGKPAGTAERCEAAKHKGNKIVLLCTEFSPGCVFFLVLKWKQWPTVTLVSTKTLFQCYTQYGALRPLDSVVHECTQFITLGIHLVSSAGKTNNTVIFVSRIVQWNCFTLELCQSVSSLHS